MVFPGTNVMGFSPSHQHIYAWYILAPKKGTLSQEQNLPGVFDACTPGLAQAASYGGTWPSDPSNSAIFCMKILTVSYITDINLYKSLYRLLCNRNVSMVMTNLLWESKHGTKIFEMSLAMIKFIDDCLSCL